MTRRHATLLALLATIALSACGGDEDTEPAAGAPDGHDPAAGNLGYWAPGGDLVLYDDDRAPYFDGIVRLGEFDGDMEALERQSDDFEIAIERAG